MEHIQLQCAYSTCNLMKILGTCCMGEIEKGGISEVRKVRKKGKKEEMQEWREGRMDGGREEGIK